MEAHAQPLLHALPERPALAPAVDEQDTLRQLATLVAQGAPPARVFAEVARCAARALGVPLVTIARYEADGTVTGRGSFSARGGLLLDAGKRVPLDGMSALALVHETGRPARIDDYSGLRGEIAAMARRDGLRSTVAVPIVVCGRLWGALLASTDDESAPLPAGSEARLESFTEVVASALANAEARDELERLAEEQAALRRVATLVARRAGADDVFAAVTEEVSRLLDVTGAAMIRLEPDASGTLVARWDRDGNGVRVGTQMAPDRDEVSQRVLRTGRAARIGGSAVGTPIVVDGRLWGAMIVVTEGRDPLPADTESRVEEFTELVATAISNVQARSELAASRARIVATADAERRRVVRNLHDGAQQRLVHTVVSLELALATIGQDDPAGDLVREGLDHGRAAIRELRELAHGIMPQALVLGGLPTGLRALAAHCSVPVALDVCATRFAPSVEMTAYFVVAEALTNVVKHARAHEVCVTGRVHGATLIIEVRDDGVGGARADGPGLVGMRDRLAAIEGRLQVVGPPTGGTVISATIPLGS
jgi:signal transduction histidine kinase